MSQLILPGRHIEVARPNPPGVPPGAIPLEHLAAHLMGQGVRAQLDVREREGRVEIVAACGPLRIPMSFDRDTARKIHEMLGNCIKAAIPAIETTAVPLADVATADTVPAGRRLAVIGD